MTSGEPGRRLIICLGPTPTMQRTMTLESVVAGELNRAAEAHDYASGKGVNAARVLHALGHAALYLGPAGGGRGELMRRDLERAGVAAEWVEAPDESRLCVTVVDRARRQATELVETARPLTKNVADALLRRLAEHLDSAAVVVMTGSFPGGGGGDDFYARALALSRQAGAKTVLDTRGPALRAALGARPDVVRPNRPELAASLGRAVSSRNAMHEAMRRMIDAGAGRVVVTRGRDGSSACDGGRFWEIGTPRGEIVSPVGSGDAYVAGVAVGLRDGLDVPEVCRYASACGAANAETLHAGHLDPLRVAAFAGQSAVREVR